LSPLQKPILPTFELNILANTKPYNILCKAGLNLFSVHQGPTVDVGLMDEKIEGKTSGAPCNIQKIK
jgi:hypothetical protein